MTPEFAIELLKSMIMLAITIAANAITTTSNWPTVISYGHDDSAAFAAAIASVPLGGRILIPHAACGVASTIALPNISLDEA